MCDAVNVLPILVDVLRVILRGCEPNHAYKVVRRFTSWRGRKARDKKIKVTKYSSN